MVLTLIVNIGLSYNSIVGVQKSFKDLYDSENEDGAGFKTSLSSRERRSRREANKKRPKS